MSKTTLSTRLKELQESGVVEKKKGDNSVVRYCLTGIGHEVKCCRPGTTSNLVWEGTSLKEEYIKWYNIAKETLGALLPLLSDSEILEFVSKKDWLILPTINEKKKSEAFSRADPNLYFSLRREGKIRIGFVCNTLESVRRMRNLLHAFHTNDKDDFVKALHELDPEFNTIVQRKIKSFHQFQTPEYVKEFEFRTKDVEDSRLSEAFKKIDRILEEGRTSRRIEGKSWLPLAPRLVIAEALIERDEGKFSRVLSALKPAYEIALRIRSDDEIAQERQRRKTDRTEERKRKFRAFVDGLISRGVTGAEYRDAVSKWNRENPPE